MKYHLHDFHIHTALCPGDDGDPDMTPEAIASKWRAAGCTAIGLTPHFHAGTDQRECLRKLEAARESISQILPCLIGCEAECLAPDGRLSVEPEVAARLDYVIASADHYNCEGVWKPPTDPRELCERHWQQLRMLAKNPLVDVIAHPFIALVLLTVEGHLSGILPIAELPLLDEKEIRSFAQLVKATGTAVEVNGFFTGPYCEKREKEGHPYQESYLHFFRILAKEGVMLSPNSDAHHLRDTGQMLSAFGWIEELGVPLRQLYFPQRRTSGKS